MFDIEFRLKDPAAEPIVFWSVTHAQYISAAGNLTEISSANIPEYDFMANVSGTYKFYSYDGFMYTFEIKDVAAVNAHHLVFNPYYSIFVI